ncbi:MAG: DUF3854 domain-containing protein [Oscillospiraceae bacterium]|nr:DUF3854 domain-containing protein [Oscillospiraceae bacterium]
MTTREKKEVLDMVPDWTLLAIGLPQITFYIVNGQYYAICPFHHDRHIGSFSYNPRNRIWKCFSCGESGRDAYALIMRVNNWSFTQTIEHLYDHRNDPVVPFKTEHSILSSGSKEKKSFNKTISYPAQDEIPDVFSVDGDVSEDDLDYIYRSFAEASPLTTEEVKYLKEVRGVYGDSMHQFFSFPDADPCFWERFCERLASYDAGTNRLYHQLLNVPGFMWDKKNQRVSFGYFGSSLGILNSDEKGKVRSIELRMKNVSSGNRYALFSAAGICDRNPERFAHGKSSNLTVDYIPHAAWCETCKGIAITEGKFKALQLSYHGYYTLNIHSVQNWKAVLPILTNADRAVPVFVAFDMDCYEKQAVADCLRHVGEKIREAGFKCYYLTWPATLGKGIDDIILAGKKSQIRCVPIRKFFSAPA